MSFRQESFAFLGYVSFYIARHVRGTGIKSIQADLSKKGERGKISSLSRVLTHPANRVGVLIGGVLYGYFLKSLPFFVEAAILTALFVITYFFVKEPKETKV